MAFVELVEDLRETYSLNKSQFALMAPASGVKDNLIGNIFWTYFILILNNGVRPIAVSLPAWFPKSSPTNVTARKPVTILFWTPTFGSWFEPLSDVSIGLVSYNSCGVPCFLTRNRSLIRSADAVVVHDRDADANDLPRYRAGHQRWVYWNMEAPPNSRPEQFFRIRNVFNWTYTYRLDSDVPHPYFTVHSRRSDAPQAEEGHSPSTVNRSRLVAWVVSNCRTPSRREEYVAELRKHVTVDVYGRCGNLQCPRSEECFRHLGERYHFYLSLENAMCTRLRHGEALQRPPLRHGSRSDGTVLGLRGASRIVHRRASIRVARAPRRVP
ncbi:hypothetical protein MTO96_010256 [Rhipicephalus appendiculatus]